MPYREGLDPLVKEMNLTGPAGVCVCVCVCVCSAEQLSKRSLVIYCSLMVFSSNSQGELFPCEHR